MRHSRRVFLGSAAAGLGAIAVSGGFDRSGLIAQARPDPMFEEIVRQLRRSTRAIQAAPRGDAVRQLASSTRLAAAWSRANGVDGRLKTALRERIAAEGRDGLLHQPIDVRVSARRRGEEAPAAFISRATTVDFTRALDDVLSRGVTQRLDALASIMDDTARRLEQRSAGVVLVGFRQDDCALAQDVLLFLECMLRFFEAVGDTESWLIVWLELCAWTQVVAWLC